MLIGDRIKKLRVGHNMSQSELGYKVDTDGSVISRWETNRSKVSQRYIVKLATALGTTTDYLLGETDDPAPQVIHVQHEPPAQERSVVEKNRGNLMYTFKDGEQLVLPDTDRGYELFSDILMQKAVMA